VKLFKGLPQTNSNETKSETLPQQKNDEISLPQQKNDETRKISKVSTLEFPEKTANVHEDKNFDRNSKVQEWLHITYDVIKNGNVFYAAFKKRNRRKQW
jgi:hypothetical protein